MAVWWDWRDSLELSEGRHCPRGLDGRTVLTRLSLKCGLVAEFILAFANRPVGKIEIVRYWSGVLSELQDTLRRAAITEKKRRRFDAAIKIDKKSDAYLFDCSNPGHLRLPEPIPIDALAVSHRRVASNRAAARGRGELNRPERQE